jgi:hypothetical protein
MGVDILIVVPMALLVLLSLYYSASFVRMGRAFDKELDSLMQQATGIVVEFVRHQNSRR